MTIWFGRLGALAALPDPFQGMAAAAVRQSTVAQTIGGGQVVSFAPGPGRRGFAMAWNHLDPDQRTVFEEFFAGLRGPGPFVLFDPSRRNHLSANQSGTTSVTNDATGFSVYDPSESVTSNPDAYLRGPRSLRWTLPATVVSGVLELDPPAGLVGVPAPAGQPWTLSGSVSLSGVAVSVSVTVTLSWRRIDGSEVSTTAGTTVVAVPGAWTAFSVSAAGPPAGAVALRAQLRVAPGVLTTAAIAPGAVGGQVAAAAPAGAVVQSGRAQIAVVPPRRPATALVIERAPISSTDVLIDRLQLDMFNGVRAWVAGTGVPQVSMVDLSPVYDVVFPYASITATFVEVG